MKVITKTLNKGITGSIDVDSDKSITHRAILIASIAKGLSKIENYLPSDDCLITLSLLESLGIKFTRDDESITIEGKGLYGYHEPLFPLYAGNSGTTMRLITGILAGQKFLSVISGDKSLNKRPMERIIAPLKSFGASIYGRSDNKYAPIIIIPAEKLISYKYHSKLASAQVKSAILFSALYNNESSIYTEAHQSRDHTERMLEFFGADIKVDKEKTITISGKNKLIGKTIEIPNDFSTASYFIALATLIKNSNLTIENVNINDTRTGFLQVLGKMGLNYQYMNEKKLGNEPAADINIKSSKLSSITVNEKDIPIMIDEVPLLAFVASQARGKTEIEGVAELAHKESNRIESTKYLFDKFGLTIDISSNKLVIKGKQKSKISEKVVINHHGDHRVAMTATIMSQVLGVPIEMDNAKIVNISAPNFFERIDKLTNGIDFYE